MIHLHRHGRVSSRLSQYCFARVLASRFSYALDAGPAVGFSGSRKRVDGEQVIGPEVMWTGHWPMEAYSNRKLDSAELFQAPGAKVTLSGFFQRFEFIAGVRDEAREDWLKLDDPLPVRGDGDFLVCLRREENPQEARALGDPVTQPPVDYLTLQVEEIRGLVKTVRPREFHVVTEQAQHPAIGLLRDLHPIVHVERGMEAFRLIHSFQKVAIGQDALDWWAAFLGRAREIYFPKIERGPWSHPEPAALAHDPAHWGIDLRVTDDPRYVYDW